MDIGKKIKELRILTGLTQEELADRAELSKGFISQLERNLTSPSIATLIDILQCLGTDLKEFFSDDPKEEQIVFHAADYFEKEDEKALDTMTVAQAKEYLAEGQFGEGTMAPKIEAAIDFIGESAIRSVLITKLNKEGTELTGGMGTLIKK